MTSSFHIITREEKTLSIQLWHTWLQRYPDFRDVKSGQKGLNYNQWNPGSKLPLKSPKEDRKLRTDSSEQLSLWTGAELAGYGFGEDSPVTVHLCIPGPWRWVADTRNRGIARGSPQRVNLDPLSISLWNHVRLQYYSLSLIFPPPLVEFSHKCNVHMIQVFTLCQELY